MTSPASNAGLFARLDTVILRVRDLAAAKRWYGEKLGLDKVLFETPFIAVLDLGGPVSLTLEYPGPDVPLAHAAGSSTCYPIFFAQDIEAAHRTLTARDVRVSSIGADGALRYFSIEDLEGNLLRVCHFA